MGKVKVIMAGSGALYPIYLGALLALEEKYQISAVAGTSGGAIAAAAWSLADIKRDSDSLCQFIRETLPSNTGTIKFSLFHFFRKWGLIDGSKLEELFEKVFKPNLSEARIPTYIYAATVERDQDVVFSSVDTPDVKTKKAVRASCSIPLVFDPTIINDQMYVDGGWSYYLPLDAFDCKETEVFAMRITKANEPIMRFNLISYIQKIMYGRIVQNYKKESVPEFITMVDFSSNYSRMDLGGITDDQAIEIFYEGYTQMKDFLKQRE